MSELLSIIRCILKASNGSMSRQALCDVLGMGEHGGYTSDRINDTLMQCVQFGDVCLEDGMIRLCKHAPHDMHGQVTAYPDEDSDGYLGIKVDSIAPGMVNNGYNCFPIEAIYVMLDLSRIPLREHDSNGRLIFKNFEKHLLPSGKAVCVQGWIKLQFVDREALMFGTYTLGHLTCS